MDQGIGPLSYRWRYLAAGYALAARKLFRSGSCRLWEATKEDRRELAAAPGQTAVVNVA